MFKVIIVSVICALALASPAERQKRRVLTTANNCLDAFNNVPNPCTNNPDNKVYFPHPTDMGKFIQCDRYGRMYIIQCPNNLEYSKTTSTCRQVAGVVTKASVGVVTQASVVVANPDNPCTAAALSTTSLYFAVKGDTSKFIECDMLGHAIILSCAPGTLWDEGRLSCVYKFPIGSSGTGIGTGTGTGTGNLKNECSAENIAAHKLFFPHPDPTKFIQCDLWGDSFVVACPAGLIWNQYLETCASAYLPDNSGTAPVGK